jgi:RND family efflux transporter MFP subunit
MMRSVMLRSIPLTIACMLVANSLVAQEVPRPVVSETVVSSAAGLRSFPGIVRATREVNLAFLTAGTIDTRPVSLGDAVEGDAVVATLDKSSLRDDAVAARASLRSAEAQAAMAGKAYQRVEELNRRGVAATSSVEAARAAMDSAGAAADAARSTVTRAEDAERYASLRTPSSGIVTAIHAEPGMTVSAGQKIITLAAGDGREAVIDVPNAYLPLFTNDMPFSITPRLVGGEPVSGRLRLIEPVVDRAARMHRVRVELQGGNLRLGSLVDVSPALDEGNILTIASSAIDRREDATRVWRVAAGRTLEAVRVELGPDIEGRVIVKSGLSEGDEILTRGIETATEGQIVGERIVQ